MRVAFCAETPPLSVNRAYMPVRWGKRSGFAKTKDAKIYALIISNAVPLLSCLVGPVAVTFRFFWPTEAGDIDGPIKLSLDALQGKAFTNDRQVKRLTVERFKDKDRPRVEVVVEEIT